MKKIFEILNDSKLLNGLMYKLMTLTQAEFLSLILILLLFSFVCFYAFLVPKKTEEEILEKQKERKEKENEKAFFNKLTDGVFSDKLTSMSYKFPYKHFIDPTESSKEAKGIKKKIADAQLYTVFTYRSFTVFKTLSAFIGLLIVFSFVIFSMFAERLFPAISLGTENITTIRFIVLAVGGVISIFPSFWLNSQANKVKKMRSKDLPILQLFLILSLRTGRSLKNILETLGDLDTRYKSTFKTASLIYLRSEKDAFDYLHKEFENTRFDTTIRALSNMGYYSKKDTINLLENSLNDIILENKEKQEKKNVVNLIVTQGSLMLPLISLGLLVLFPIISHVASLIGNQTF